MAPGDLLDALRRRYRGDFPECVSRGRNSCRTDRRTTVVKEAGVIIGLSKAGIVFAAIVNGVLGAAVSYGLSELAAPNQKPRPGSADALRSIYRGTAEPAVVVFGETVLSGLLVYARSVHEDGTPRKVGKIFHAVLAICMGPIDAITRITLNDQPSTSEGFRDRTLFIKKLGYRDQQPIQGPFRLNRVDTVLPLEWTAKRRALSGVAYVHAIMRHSFKNFPRGAPGMRFRVRGRLCWDPREDVSAGGTQSFTDETTWKFSNHPVVCGIHYLTNKIYGRDRRGNVFPRPLCRLSLIRRWPARCRPVLITTLNVAIFLDSDQTQSPVATPRPAALELLRSAALRHRSTVQLWRQSWILPRLKPSYAARIR